MHFKIIRVCSIILFIFVLCDSGLAGQKLRYRFEMGKAYRYSLVVDSKTSGQMGSQEFTASSSAKIDYSIILAKATDRMYTLKVTFENFYIKLNVPMMGFNDSTITMKEYVGKRMKVMVTDQGKAVLVEPIDTIPPSSFQVMANLNPSDLFKQLFLELPDKELDINGSWKKDIPDTTFRNGMKMIVKHNIEFKVVGSEKKSNYDCWKITINGTSTIEGNGSQRGSDVTVDGTARVNGTVYFAPKEGVFVLAEQPTETDVTTTATGSETGVSTLSVSTTVKTALMK